MCTLHNDTYSLFFFACSGNPDTSVRYQDRYWGDSSGCIQAQTGVSTTKMIMSTCVVHCIVTYFHTTFFVATVLLNKHNSQENLLCSVACDRHILSGKSYTGWTDESLRVVRFHFKVSEKVPSFSLSTYTLFFSSFHSTSSMCICDISSWVCPVLSENYSVHNIGDRII